MKYKLNQILLDDCMNVMADIPDKYFELAIVDPPYGIGESNASFESRGCSSPKWKRARPTVYEKKDWDKEIPPPEYFIELFRVSLNQIIFGGNYFTDNLRPSMGWVFWDKVTSGDYSDGELIFSSFNKALRKFSFTWSGFRRAEICTRIHPTQKPVTLYRWLLQNYAKPGDKIIDTHSGSGSCAIACHIEKHDFLAIEKDPDYHAASVKRLEEVRAQGVLF